jgi:hypothetical protein
MFMPLPDSIIEVLTVFRPLFTARSDVEETDDLVDWNAVGQRPSHRRGGPACHWQRYGRQLESLSSGARAAHAGLRWR